jgi:hypothetical protein
MQEGTHSKIAFIAVLRWNNYTPVTLGDTGEMMVLRAVYGQDLEDVLCNASECLPPRLDVDDTFYIKLYRVPVLVDTDLLLFPNFNQNGIRVIYKNLDINHRLVFNALYLSCYRFYGLAISDWSPLELACVRNNDLCRHIQYQTLQHVPTYARETWIEVTSPLFQCTPMLTITDKEELEHVIARPLLMYIRNYAYR